MEEFGSIRNSALHCCELANAGAKYQQSHTFRKQIVKKILKNTSEHDPALRTLNAYFIFIQTSGSFSLMAQNMLTVNLILYSWKTLAMVFRVVQIQTVLRLRDFPAE